MQLQLASEHRLCLRTETALSVAINTVISGLFAWGIFRGTEFIPLWGGQGIVVDLVPTVFMITLVLTVALTLVIRRRIRRGVLPRPDWSRADLGVLGRLPAHLALRAPALASGMTILLVPVSALLLVAAGVDGMAWQTFFLFKLAYGAAFALIVTPVILLRALADGSAPTP